MEKLTVKDFDKLFALMKQSFIEDELRPYDEQKALFAEPIYHVFAKYSDDHQDLKAFIALWNFDTFVFVDYFAVHPRYRNLGIGQEILAEVRKMTPKDIFLEIEEPTDDMTYRRLKFYQRNQFELCQFAYHQPPIARGNAPVALSLMGSRKLEDEKEFSYIKSQIYEYAYKRFL